MSGKAGDVSVGKDSFWGQTNECALRLTAIRVGKDKVRASSIDLGQTPRQAFQIMQTKRSRAILAKNSAIPDCIRWVKVDKITSLHLFHSNCFEIFTKQCGRI